MARFRMKPKVGPHNYNGTWVNPGDILECSHEELVSVMDKFEEIREPTPAKTTKVKLEEPILDQEVLTKADKGHTKELNKDVSDAIQDDPDDALADLKNYSKNFELVHKGRGRYDVVNTASGKTINDEPLSKKEAQALVEGR